MTDRLKKAWDFFLAESLQSEEDRMDTPDLNEALDEFMAVAPKDPEGFLELVQNSDQEGLEVMAPFFTDVARANGIEWYDKIQEALPDHATELVYRNLNNILKKMKPKT